MNNKMNIKKLLREGLLKEILYTTMDLHEGTGLFVEENNSGATLTLYNPKNKMIYGTITFISHITYGEWHYVSGVASNRGYGPLMYELAFMYVDSINSKLMPSRDGDVKEGAFNVWKKMYERNDIDKLKINIEDDNYRFDILTGDEYNTTEEERIEWYNESTEEEKQALNVFNTAYSKSPSKDYIELINTANSYSEDIHDRTHKIGDDLWKDLYNR